MTLTNIIKTATLTAAISLSTLSDNTAANNNYCLEKPNQEKVSKYNKSYWGIDYWRNDTSNIPQKKEENEDLGLIAGIGAILLFDGLFLGSAFIGMNSLHKRTQKTVDYQMKIYGKLTPEYKIHLASLRISPQPFIDNYLERNKQQNDEEKNK